VALLAVRPVLLLPGQAFAALAGVLWGTLRGSALALLGAALAMWLVTTLGRRLLRRRLGRLAGERRDEWARVARRHDLAYAALVTLNPLLPTDLCMALGSGAGARRGRLVAGAVLGSVPGTIAAAALGSAASREEPVLGALSLLGLAVSLVGGALLARKAWGELRGRGRRWRPRQRPAHRRLHPLQRLGLGDLADVEPVGGARCPSVATWATRISAPCSCSARATACSRPGRSCA
jgi:uncharacterized membrane protein YdjX (TVP38/TMEM64 family)